MAPVLVDRWHGAVRVRFDDPDRRNPLGPDTVRSLSAALSEDPSAIAVVGSTDPRSFSSGADVRVDDAVRRQISDDLYECYRAMLTRPGVVLAVVQGAAVGGGAQLSTAADLRLAGPGARWRWVGPGHGLAVGAWILPALVGRGRALELTLTSRWVHAVEATSIGLAASAGDDPWAAAAALLDRLASLDPHALTRLKQVSLHRDLIDALEAEREGNRSWNGRAPAGTSAIGPGQ